MYNLEAYQEIKNANSWDFTDYKLTTCNNSSPSLYHHTIKIREYNGQLEYCTLTSDL